MKKIFAVLGIATILLASCKKDTFDYTKDNNGTLSLAGFSLAVDKDVQTVTRADAADGSYAVFLYDSQGDLVWQKAYSELEGEISLTAGNYTLEARSTSAEVPDAEFSNPVYGVTKSFSIVAGQTTSLGTLTCTLLQVAAIVKYNDAFLKTVTGDGSTTIEVTAGSPLEYSLSYGNGSPSYEQRTGYFAINNGDNTTMSVTFKGMIEGKNQRMKTSITGMKARDLHIITIMKKEDASGNASFVINIDGLIADATLENDVSANEEGDGNDPNAPTGDGGIELVSTCDYDISKPVTVPASGAFNMTMQAKIPNGARKFTVDIASTNQDFINSVNTVGGTTLDLIYPSEAAMGVFDIVPFPHGADLLNKTTIDFDLSGAQTPLLGFKGTHTFTMNVTDNKGCKNSIAVSLVVE